METKALKRQMGAAIAMVLVAAIALAASTYAWFANNNKVIATTSTITAQSNAPFLMIKKDTDQDLKETMITYAVEGEASTSLYPAQAVRSMDNGVTTPIFQSAYGSDLDKADEAENTRFTVGDAEKAVKQKYALSETFQIGTKDANAGSFSNLKVEKVEVASTANAAGLDGAISVLLMCGDKWAVYKASADGNYQLTTYADNIIAVNCTAADGVLASKIDAGTTQTVKAYVFYDGSDGNVKSNNIDALKNCNLKITFVATPVNTVDTAKKADAGTDNANGKQEDVEGQGGETPTI